MNDEKMTEKQKLDDDIANFLAKGGKIKEEPIRVVTDLKRITEDGKKRFNSPISNAPR